MLKVMKYDWENGWRSVRFTLIAALLSSIALGVLSAMNGGRPEIQGNQIGIFADSEGSLALMLTAIVWFAVMVALFVITICSISNNLSSRMFGKEAYFTHTLPVETWELLGGKALGTWLFGVFMVFVALVSFLIVMVSAAAASSYLGEMMEAFIKALPKLGGYHLQTMVKGLGWAILGLVSFLAWSFMMIIQLQFLCIGSRLFGKHHLAGGVILFVVLLDIEGRLNNAISFGFIVVLISSAACFLASNYLLKKKLSL